MKDLGYIYRGIIFLLLLVQAAGAPAQQPNLVFRSLSTLEDVTNSIITSVIQDSVGYLWIGTEEGLYRFDGQNLFNYQHVNNDPNTIPSSKVLKLYIDIYNKLWVCTNDGIGIYNPELDHFDHVVSATDARGIDAYEGYYFNSIKEDHAGQLYIADDKSIYRYDRSQNLFINIIKLEKGKINAFLFDEQDNIWMATSNNGGLQFYDLEQQLLSFFLNDPENNQTIASNELLGLALVDKTLWIATYGGGVDAYHLDTRTFKHYLSPAYFENFVKSIFVDQKKNIWVCTLGGLKLFEPSIDNFYNYYFQQNNPNSLGKNLAGFYEDLQGNYWTIHATGGLKFVNNTNKFLHIDTNEASFFHVSDQNVTTISMDGFGALWVGNYYNGIDVLNWDENMVDRFLHDYDNPNSLGNGTIFDIFRDSKQQMWVGSNFGGLQKFIPETKLFETYKNNPHDTLSIAGDDVRSITEDHNGDLWVAVHGRGVDRFDIKTKTFQHFNSSNSGLSNDYTIEVLNDSRGNLWVATAWGLSLLKKGENRFTFFVNNENDSTSINHSNIQTVYEDGQQHIWVATQEGLNRFNFETSTFDRYSNGLQRKKVMTILSDDDNNIWVGTNLGISKLEPETKRFINFDQNDGLLSKEYSNRSGFKNKSELFFGGLLGIDHFNPDQINIVTTPPSVILTEFKLFNRNINPKENNSIIQKHISYADKIILGHNDNSFSIHFQSINLITPNKLSYCYQLLGFDKDWIYADTKRDVGYTNLKPGKYTFRVKAKYGNEDWSDQITKIDLIIVPAWWMTLWFKIIVVLSILFAVSGLVFWRINQFSIQSKKLELLVAERTNEIQNKNNQLKALNSTKDKLFSIISHDLRSPFNAIMGFQNLLLNDYYQHSDNSRLRMIRQINLTTNKVYYLVENLLNWASVQTSNIKPQPEKLILKEVVNEKLDLYRNIAESKGVTLTLGLTYKNVVYADVNLLEAVLRNLVNNAIKFTPAGGTILVKAIQDNDVVVLSVTDTGIGMTREQISQLFNIETTKIKKGTNGETGSGLGLLLCKEFVEKNRGSITVESKVGKGSVFSFTLPASPWKEQ